MSEILVVAEQRRGELSPATLEVIAAGIGVKQARAARLAVAVIAREPDSLVPAISLAGVDEVIKVPVPVAEFQNDIFESAVLALIEARKPSLVLVPHSIDAWGYAPVVAAKTGCGFATDVFAIAYDGDDLVATRAAYSEKVHKELDFPGKDTVLLTLRANVFKPVEETGAPTVSSFEAPVVKPRSEHRQYIEPDSAGGEDITQAEFMLSVGRGVGEEDNVEQFEELADLMSFTLGCSRPIADNGWLPKYRQVGQSGKTVSKCQIYLAMGISGSVQHMAGMKHVPNIIAVNTDPEASIFSIARYGVVADIFDIAEELKNHFE